jgi:parvulin-like peptidyl-prolyl isomerase
MEAGRPVPGKPEVLQEMIERKVMLQKARTDEAMQDPIVQRSLENQLLSQWLEGSLQRAKNEVTVTDDELRAAYEASLASHTRPAMIRVAMLYRKASGNEEERASIRAGLLAVRENFLRDPATATQGGRISGFGALAADASVDAISRYRGGDIGWYQPGQEKYRYPDEVMNKAFALNKGETSDLIEMGDDWYVVMKSDERPAMTTPFEEAKVTMRRRMIREKQTAVEAQFKSNLMSGVEVEIDQEMLDRLAWPLRMDTGTTPDLPTAPGDDSTSSSGDS